MMTPTYLASQPRGCFRLNSIDSAKTAFNRRDAKNAEILPRLVSLRTSRLCGSLGVGLGDEGRTPAHESTFAEALSTVPPLPFRRGEGRGDGSVLSLGFRGAMHGAFVALFLSTCPAGSAAIPSAEKLLPDDTL